MLEYIYEEEKESLSKIRSDQCPERCVTGFMTRIMAYVMISTNLETIFEKEYDSTKKVIKHLGYERILPSRRSIKKQREDIAKYFIYRNKIFAHSSFAKAFEYEPVNNIWIRFLNFFRGQTNKLFVSRKKEDTLSTQHTSLAYLSGSLTRVSQKNIALGDSYLIIEKSKPIELPYLDIVTDHLKVREHFSKWGGIFSGIIGRIEEIGLENIKDKGDFDKVILQS